MNNKYPKCDGLFGLCVCIVCVSAACRLEQTKHGDKGELMDNITNEQLQTLKKDIESGLVMIVTAEHFRELEAENEEVKGLLVRYGSHFDNCFSRVCINNELGKCSCGFDKALEGDSHE